MLLFDTSGVGALGSPVKTGSRILAFKFSEASTYVILALRSIFACNSARFART